MNRKSLEKMNTELEKQLPRDFNVFIYLYLYVDVAEHCKDNPYCAKKHYLEFGKHENRVYSSPSIPQDFDWQLYLYLNHEVKNTASTYREAIDHYIHHGIREKRNYKFLHIPEDFQPEIYYEWHLQKRCPYNYYDVLYHYESIGRRAKMHYKITEENTLNNYNEHFDWIMYKDLNPDISHLLINEEEALAHFIKDGRWKARPFHMFFKNIPSDFNYTLYLEINPDIKRLYNTEVQAKLHYEMVGCYQNRCYYPTMKKPALHTNYLFNKYNVLFHKYIFQFTNPQSPLSYLIKTPRQLSSHYPLITHIHCHNLTSLPLYFSQYLPYLIMNSFVIITYVQGEINQPIVGKGVHFLHMENRGMDIGGKFMVVHFLNTHKINYDYILFLHSKSHNELRKCYMDPFFINMNWIKENMKTKEYGLLVPPLIYYGDYLHIIYNLKLTPPETITPRWTFGNELYIHDLDKYMDLNPDMFLFPEGNCFLCNSVISNALYSDPLLFNILNTEKTPDLVWTISRFKERQLLDVGNNLEKVNQYRKTNDLFNNNLEWGDGHHGHPDHMIEHNFERLVFKVAQKYQQKVKILPYTLHEGRRKYINNILKMTDSINHYLEHGTFL